MQIMADSPLKLQLTEVLDYKSTVLLELCTNTSILSKNEFENLLKY